MAKKNETTTGAQDPIVEGDVVATEQATEQSATEQSATEQTAAEQAPVKMVKVTLRRRASFAPFFLGADIGDEIEVSEEQAAMLLESEVI